MKTDLFLWIVLVLYSNIVLYITLRCYTMVKSFKDFTKFNDSIFYVIQFTYVAILLGYWALKYTGKI